ncbi:MAG: sugar kinase [Desulfovibrio sp.]|nr:MAG: sugar kinase [Desulfovibrio sp.]
MEQHAQPYILALGEPLMELSALEQGCLSSVNQFLTGFGGDASNFAVAAGRSGGNVGMLTTLGDDQFGDAFMTMWQREGVDTSHVRRDPQAPTGLYLIARAPGRHDFTYYRRGSAASRMAPDNLPEEAIRKAGLLHVTGVTQGISSGACDTAFQAMRMAREAGVTISYDPNFRPALWPLSRARAIIHESIALADLVFPSMEEASLMLGVTDPELALQQYLDMGSAVVVLKLGPGGALIGNGENRIHIDPIEVEAVDASGAGDTLAGAFAAAYLEGRPLEWCGRFAVAAAGLSTLGLGCVGPIPDRETIYGHMQGSSE